MHPKPTLSTNSDYPTRIGNAIDAIDRRLKGNLLINGAFQVWQRGTSFASSAGGAVFTADRWALFRIAPAVGATASRQTGGNAQYCMRLQRDNGNAATNIILIGQSLESADCAPYRSQYVRLGFRARAGANFSAASAILTGEVYSGTGTDESIHVSYAGAVSQASVSAVLTSSFQDFVTPAVQMPSNMNEMAIRILFTPVGTAGAADYAEIEEVQLITGEFVGNFPYRSLAEEFANCRRYARVEDFRVPATTAVSERINMRAIPTISGGGAGYTSTGTTKDALVHFQTAGAIQTLTLAADI
jgi:hypothetical protein